VAILSTVYSFAGISTSTASAPSSECTIPDQNVISMLTGGTRSGPGNAFPWRPINFPNGTGVVWIPPIDFNPTYNWSQVLSGSNGAVPVPENVMEQLRQMPDVISQVPNMNRCSPGYLFGAPTAKIVVSQLTDSSTTTIYKDGAYSAITTSYHSNTGTTTESKTVSDTSSPGESLSSSTSAKSVSFKSPTGINSVSPQVSPSPTHSAVTTAMVGLVGPSQTLVAGAQPITVSGTTYSLASHGNALVVNGHTSTLSSGARVIAIGSQTFTYNPSASSVLVISGQTLVPGGSAITVSGKTILLPASGTNVVVASAGKTTSIGVGGYIISGLKGPGTQTGASAVFTGSGTRGLSMSWILSITWTAGLIGLFWKSL
jgi:hypothetical protein